MKVIMMILRIKYPLCINSKNNDVGLVDYKTVFKQKNKALLNNRNITEQLTVHRLQKLYNYSVSMSHLHSCAKICFCKSATPFSPV